jgi:hypothetical protein
MKTKTQIEAVLNLLKKGRTLNWINTFELTGCSSIARRIPDFEKKGYKFKRERINFKTRFGTSGNYMNYTLDKKSTPKHLLN